MKNKKPISWEEQVELNADIIIKWLDSHPGGTFYTNRGIGKSRALRKIFARGPWNEIFIVCLNSDMTAVQQRLIHSEYSSIPQNVLKSNIIAYTESESRYRGVENLAIYFSDIKPSRFLEQNLRNNIAGCILTDNCYVTVKQLQSPHSPEQQLRHAMATQHPWEHDVEL